MLVRLRALEALRASTLLICCKHFHRLTADLRLSQKMDLRVAGRSFRP